jgi:hypothetical protein
MRNPKWYRVLFLTVSLLAVAAAAYAGCTTTTYVVNGRVVVCQVCTENGNTTYYCN